MTNIPHTAFYIDHYGDKDWLLQQISRGTLFEFSSAVRDLKGEIFSNSVLQQFIAEEILHDQFEITTVYNNSLSSSSSGEQRKALLSYIIAKKPGYLIIDNVFESLDKDTRQSILLTLNELSATTLIFQVFSRINEILPFIQTIFTIQGRMVVNYMPRESFPGQLNSTGNNSFEAAIPPPLTNYELQKGPLVKMNKVSVHFQGRPILHNICWEINTGEFWQLTGPNGSGKSTLLSLITGNSPKGYGQDLFLFGHRKGSGETVWEIKKKIGYFTPAMTQQFERHDSIEKMIISGFVDSVGLYLKPTDRQVQLAREWLLLIGMFNEKDQPFRMLPEGWQRMTLIARAMVKHPPLLILDEPTAGLDDEMAALFTALINKIAAETNTAIIYVSHKDETALTPNRIFSLSITEQGSVGQVQL